MFCPKCGAKKNDGANFCANCGASLPAASWARFASAGSVKLRITPLSKRRHLIIGSALAVVAVVLLAGFFVMPALHKSPFKDAKVGDIVQFGSFEQDGDDSDGKEPIEWRVLAVDGDHAYVVSEKVLDDRVLNESRGVGIDWDSSDLKAWLEGDFSSTAFSTEERKAIDGAPTILSLNEAREYFQSDDDRICFPTQAVVEKAGYVSDAGGAWGWWLRMPSSDADNVAVVNPLGDISCYGSFVVNKYFGARPALLVKR